LQTGAAMGQSSVSGGRRRPRLGEGRAMAKDLVEDYRDAGFGGPLEFGARPALIVVDMVRAYFDPGSPLYAGVERTLESTLRVLAAARDARLPIVLTGVRYTPGGINGGIFYRKVPSLRIFDEGSPLGRFAEGIEPRAGEIVIIKQYASAFFGTSLAATLTSLQVDTTIITGVTTSGCVRATTLDAMQYGFIPYVVRDAVGDRDSRPHEANLFDLAAKYAEVVSENDIVGLIGSRAGWRSRTNQSSTSRDTSPARGDTSNARRETSNR
jgi:maleamate amidohydrolase